MSHTKIVFIVFLCDIW